MSKKSNNNLLLIAAVGVGGYLLWKHSTAPAIAAGGSSAPLTSNPPTPAPAVLPPPTSQSFIQSLAPSSIVPVTANDPRLTDINQWINTLSPANANQARTALTQMSQAEIAGLYDIVHNDFYGNGITTPEQRTFWNAWRVKYHVLDGTYS